MLNIHRIDHEASHTHCWRVTVQRRTRVYVRSFSDGRYCGAQQALLAAQAYRDELITSHPPLSKPVYCAILKKTNRSGISGLSRVDRWEVSGGPSRPSSLLGSPVADRELSITAQEVFHPQVRRRRSVSTGSQGTGNRHQGDLVADVFAIRIERPGERDGCVATVLPGGGSVSVL